MTSKEKTPHKGNQFEFYMDLLGHDVLNGNQAVLSYLELILASPGADKKTKEFAEKALAHVRTTTILIENVKRLIGTRAIDFRELKPVDLVKAVGKAELELARFYPGKTISLVHASKVRSAMVYGDTYAKDLVLNVFVTAVGLNLGNDIHMTLAIDEDKMMGNPVWVVRIEDRDAQLPAFLDGEGVAATYNQDISLAVKTTGMLSAKMIAGNLGGDFEAHAMSRETKKTGAIFTIALRKVENP